MLSYMPHCEERCDHAASKQAWEAHASTPQLPFSEYLHHRVPLPGVVLDQSLQLEHRTQGQEHMEYLVTLTHKIAPAWEEALGDGAGEEDGRQHEGDNLQSVEGERWLLGPGDGGQAMGYWADIQQVGCRGGDQLADLSLPGVWPLVPGLSDTAAEAGEPPKQGSAQQEPRPDNAFSPGYLRGVEVMSQRGPVLINGHAHVVKEEEDVVRMFATRVQEVSRHAEEHVGKRRR